MKSWGRGVDFARTCLCTTADGEERAACRAVIDVSTSAAVITASGQQEHDDESTEQTDDHLPPATAFTRHHDECTEQTDDHLPPATAFTCHHDESTEQTDDHLPPATAFTCHHDESTEQTDDRSTLSITTLRDKRKTRWRRLQRFSLIQTPVQPCYQDHGTNDVAVHVLLHEPG